MNDDRFLPDARDAWNRGAAAYSHFIESGADWYRVHVHGPGLLAACGDIGGRQALDLGCGQGYFSRELAHAGAQVQGVDLSEKLIERARALETEAPLGIEYRVLDAADVGGAFAPRSFDLVTGCMSLQDMARVPDVLVAAAQVLRGQGRLVFSVPHPCTELPVRYWQRDASGGKVALVLDRYFESGPAVCDWNMPRLRERWQTPYWRYTLGEWVGLLRAAGYALVDLQEPHPTPAQVLAHPPLADCARMPYFLVIVATPVA